MRGWETEMIPLDLCKRPWSMVLDNLVKGEFSRHSLWTSFEIGPVGDWLISLNMQKIYYLDYTSSCWCINGEGSHHHKWWINLKKKNHSQGFCISSSCFLSSKPNQANLTFKTNCSTPSHGSLDSNIISKECDTWKRRGVKSEYKGQQVEYWYSPFLQRERWLRTCQTSWHEHLSSQSSPSATGHWIVKSSN